MFEKLFTKIGTGLDRVAPATRRGVEHTLTFTGVNCLKGARIANPKASDTDKARIARLNTMIDAYYQGR
jgi:hypothetical protein